MGQVINSRDLFFRQKCPVGSLAIHPIHGMCEVKYAKEFKRVIEVIIPDGMSCFVKDIIVDVRELKTVDPLNEL